MKNVVLLICISLLILILFESTTMADSQKGEESTDKKLIEQTRNTQDVNVLNTTLPELVRGLSEKQLLLIGKDVADPNERMYLRDVAGKELRQRIIDGVSLTPFLEQIQNKSEDGELRAFALLVLNSSQELLQVDEKKRIFDSAKTIAFDKAEKQNQVRLSALITANDFIYDLDRLRTVDPVETIAYAKNLQIIMQDKKENDHLRRAAIKGMALVKYKEAIPDMVDLIEDEDNINNALIARSTCVALADLGADEAIEFIGWVLSDTEHSDIHSSAAYALGSFQNKRAIDLLVNNARRFDNGSCSSAINRQAKLVISSLDNPSSENITSIIKATKFLYKQKHRRMVKPKLINLASHTSDLKMVKLLLTTLYDLCSKEECKEVIRHIKRNDFYGDEWDRVYFRAISMSNSPEESLTSNEEGLQND